MFQCSSWEDGIMNRKQEEVFKKKMLVLLYMNICQHFLAKSSYYEVKIC